MTEENKPSVVDLKTKNGDESWPLPEAWIDEDIVFAYRDTLMMTEQGPQFVNLPAKLVADLGTAIHVSMNGAEMVIPKNVLQQVIKPSAIQLATALPGALKN